MWRKCSIQANLRCASWGWVNADLCAPPNLSWQPQPSQHLKLGKDHEGGLGQGTFCNNPSGNFAQFKWFQRNIQQKLSRLQNNPRRNIKTGDRYNASSEKCWWEPTLLAWTTFGSKRKYEAPFTQPPFSGNCAWLCLALSEEWNLSITHT